MTTYVIGCSPLYPVSLPQVVAWYDNEWGYSQRVVDLCDKMAHSLEPSSKKVLADPLEEFCKGSPDSDECKVFED